MTTRSCVLFPPSELANCLSFAIVRDTRKATLCDKDRLNYFPASPLVAFTVVLQGELHVSSTICELAEMRGKEVLQSISVTPPQATPTQSWSSGSVHAITVGFYPDAWALLGGDIGTNMLPSHLENIASRHMSGDQIEVAWTGFCNDLVPIWSRLRAANQSQQWVGSHRIADWTRQLLTRVALSGAGQSARSFERRMKRWTGQSKQSLNAFAKLEDLQSLRNKEPDATLAMIAAAAEFSDQSHMGRAVKKATGFSPDRLNWLIENEEAFWCYRLLGERL